MEKTHKNIAGFKYKNPLFFKDFTPEDNTVSVLIPTLIKHISYSSRISLTVVYT